MNARYQSGDYHKRGEKVYQSTKRSADGGVFDTKPELKRRRRHHGGGQQSGRGGIGRFRTAVYKDGTVIDDDLFKKEIEGDHQNVISAEDEKSPVDLKDTLPFYPLTKSEDAKAECNGKRNDSQPIGDGVKGHIDPGQSVKGEIERRKSDAGSSGTDAPDVNAGDQCRPDDKSAEKYQRKTETLYFFML